MITNYKTKDSKVAKIKILSPMGLRGYKQGQTICVETDDRGIPNDKYWRNRLKDSKSDNCIEVLKDKDKDKDKKEK